MAPTGKEKATENVLVSFSCGLEFSDEEIIFKLGGGQDEEKNLKSKKGKGYDEGVLLFQVGPM
jgi:hypothetical protein